MTEETAEILRLDYSKPPPGYEALRLDGEEMYRRPGARLLPLDGPYGAWAFFKKDTDPPGMAQWYASFTEGCKSIVSRGERGEEHNRAIRFAAWAWYDRLLALREKLNNGVWCPECHSNDAYTEAIDATTCTQPWCTECDVEMGALFDDQWPEMLGWSDDHVTEVERWLADSTAEMPEVLRG